MRDGNFAHVYTDLIDAKGESVGRTKEPFDNHGAPYPEVLIGNSLMSTSDDGIVAEDLETGYVSDYAGKGLIAASDHLHIYQNGVLVVKDTTILHIDLTRP